MQEEEEKPAWATLPRLPASSGLDGGRLSTCWALTFPCAGWSGCRWMLGPRKPRLTTGDPAGAPINDEVQRAGWGGRRRGRPAVPAHPQHFKAIVSLLFSHSVMSDSWRPHGLQHATSRSFISRSSLKLMSIELMPSDHLIESPQYLVGGSAVVIHILRMSKLRPHG